MVFTCELCDIKVSSSAMLDSHLQGLRHLERLKQTNELRQIAERSVFLSKFTEPIDVQSIEHVLRRFGELDRIILEKQDHSFAIVEFKQPEVAQALIRQLKSLEIGNNKVCVLPRKTNFISKKSSNSISSYDVVECLKSTGPGFLLQTDALIAKFLSDSSTISDRVKFSQELGQFLQRYFNFPISLNVFGSTVTGLAFVDSDLDLNFYVDGIDITSSNGQCCSTGNSPLPNRESRESLLQASLESPLTKEVFTSMKNADRAKLLNKIINVFRKQTGLISNLVPVPDAKCPIVRFVIRKPNTYCELSIQNLFGEKKANFVKDLIEADSSGNLRRFIILLKLWAHVNGLLTDASNLNSKAHWNSYTLSLLIISFFQSVNSIPQIDFQLGGNLFNGWMADYSFQKFDLGDFSGIFSSTFRNLLIFIHETLHETKVHSIRDKCIYSKSEFKECFVDVDERFSNKWRFSLVNVQDPIELNHNVAAGVSKHFLSMIRWKLMFSISLLKKHPDDLTNLFELKEFNDVKAVGGSGINKNEKLLKFGMTPGHSVAELSEFFISIFEDILLLEQLVEPDVKRSRMSDVFNEFSFSVNFPVWMGRRPIRRQLAPQHKNLSLLELEREVSRELRYRSRMRTIPSQTDNDQFPLQFTLKLLLDCDYLCCFFNFGEEQESPASQDFFHFINTFVPKYVSDIAFLENSDRQTTPSTTLIQPQHCERNGSDDMDTN